MLVAFIFLTACTDYVQQIKDRYGEWETSDEIVGSITDSRDGQTYKTVKIGSQIWMAENLNYKTENSWCGGGNGTAEGDCSKYGRLYTWAAAMDSVGAWSKNGKGCGYGTTCSPTYPVRGICPEGWHLPTEAEFETLFTAVGGKSTAGKVLKSTTGWTTYSGITNEDAFAFSALPAGYRNLNGYCYNEGDYAYFWCSTEGNTDYAYNVNLYYGNGGAYLGSYSKGYGFSVRCLKDDESEPSAKSSSSAKKVSSSSVTKSSSSQKTVSSSSVKVTKPAEVTLGSITDSRDGQTYKTVKIGSQIWMAENLNYKTENSWCGGGNGTAEGDCSKYGRLYTWAAAMDSVGAWSKNGKGCGYGTTCSPTYPVRGICPEGWHLPTEAEFETLFTAVGGKSTAGKVLKSTTGWTTYSGITNEDAFAFSALPAGGRYSGGSFSCEGDVAYFWSSTEYYGFDACLMYLDYCYGGAGLFDYNKYDGFSVRCLKD